MSDSSFQINIDTFDPSDLGSVGTGGTRVFSSSSSVQSIENNLQIDRRWNAAMSIGNFSRLTETNPDMDSDDSNIIRIEFEDSLGNSKEIIIKYK